MRAYFGKHIHEVFKEILVDLTEAPDFVASPRGLEVKEIRDCSIQVDHPLMNLYKNKHRSSPLKYCAAELLWYFAGTNDPTFIENYATLWKGIHNPDGTVSSAYVHLLFAQHNEHGISQYKWVIECLKSDKDSRQAFMHFNKPMHQWFWNKDQVCTLQALFHIREDKLYMTITMRSNDVIYGFMTDWVFFSILHHHVFLHLKQYYPQLQMGSYTHISHSMHLYERHYELVDKMLEEDFELDSTPLMNTTILDEEGNIKPEYKKFLKPIQSGKKPDFSKKTGNTLLDWCFETLK